MQRVLRCPSDHGDFANRKPVYERRGSSYQVEGSELNREEKDLEKIGSCAATRHLAHDLFKPWDSEEPLKVMEKIAKGELGPVPSGARQGLQSSDGGRPSGDAALEGRGQDGQGRRSQRLKGTLFYRGAMVSMKSPESPIKPRHRLLAWARRWHAWGGLIAAISSLSSVQLASSSTTRSPC